MLYLLIWWVSLELIGLSILPFTLNIFKNLPDSGYPLSRCLGLILLSYLVWIPVYLKICPFTFQTIFLFLLLLTVICWFSSTSLRREAFTFLLKNHRLILFYESLGLCFFILFIMIRSTTPDILGAEKYMDFAILNSLVRSVNLPPPDPWLSGYTIHYYYFGHYMYALLTKFTHIPAHYSYNYALCTVFTLCTYLSSSLGFNLWHCYQKSKGIKNIKMCYLAGILSVLFLVFVSNLDGLLQFLQNKSILQIDYWQSSRIIPNTINEFPFFSFIHGDLHAHVLNIPHILLFFTLLFHFILSLENLFRRVILTGLVLGIITVTNPWDFPTSILLIGWIWIYHYPLKKSYMIIIIPFLSILFIYPFIIQFTSSFAGVSLVKEKTELSKWIVLYGIPILLLFSGLYSDLKIRLRNSLTHQFIFTGSIFLSFLMAIILNHMMFGFLFIIGFWCIIVMKHIRDNHSLVFCYSLFSVALFIALVCEIIYFQDVFNDTLPRMNTIFKSYYFIGILFSIGSSFILFRLLNEGNQYLSGGLIALLVMSLVYPVGAIYSRSEGFKHGFTMNGWKYLEKNHKDDYEAIRWIQKEITGSPVILEYSKEPYTYAGRVSSNTGLPTLLGWGNHEFVWRNDSELVHSRLKDVHTIYTTMDVELAQKLIDKYKIRYIFLGELENQMGYHNNIKIWDSLGKLVYMNGNTKIFEIKQ